jgi:hypothetical protein
MAEPKTSVLFVCQRCQQPLKLDSSFGSLREHTIAELARTLWQHITWLNVILHVILVKCINDV